jgi:hypothetical protein
MKKKSKKVPKEMQDIIYEKGLIPYMPEKQ